MRSYILLFLILLSVLCQAQNFEQKIQQKYLEAENAYNNSDYLRAVNKLTEAQQLLGGTNLKIQTLYIYACYHLKQWQFTKNAIVEYSNLNTNTSSPDFVKIIQIEKDVDQKIASEDTEYQNVIIKNQPELYEKFLENYPFSKYVVKIKELKKNEGESEVWHKAQLSDNAKNYFDYIRKFPTGSYLTLANKAINRLDSLNFRKASSLNTTFALNDYLNIFPAGTFRTQAIEKINLLQDDSLFNDANNNASKSNSEIPYEEYLKKIPGGNHYDEALNNMFSILLKKADESYKLKNWKTALSQYQTCIDKREQYILNRTKKIPDTKKDIVYIETNRMLHKQIDNCNKHINQTGMSLIAVSVDTETAFGFSVENMRIGKLGYFMQANMNYNFLWGADTEFTTDNAGNHHVTDDVIVTDETKQGVVSFTGGINYKLLYPVWLNAGIGFGYFPLYLVARNEQRNYEHWLLNTDESGFRFFPVIGLNIKLSDFWVIKYNLMYREKLIHQFGIGINF